MKSLSKIFTIPSAWIPLLMSVCAMGLIIVYVTLFGITKNSGDEGTPARIFQMLLLFQIPFIAYFISKWVKKDPKQFLPILIIQLAAILLSVATIVVLEG